MYLNLSPRGIAKRCALLGPFFDLGWPAHLSIAVLQAKCTTHRQLFRGLYICFQQLINQKDRIGQARVCLPLILQKLDVMYQKMKDLLWNSHVDCAHHLELGLGSSLHFANVMRHHDKSFTWSQGNGSSDSSCNYFSRTGVTSIDSSTGDQFIESDKELPGQQFCDVCCPAPWPVPWHHRLAALLSTSIY